MAVDVVSNGNKRVVITGMGVISPVGLTVSEMWEALVAGKCGIDYISSFDTTNFRTKYAAEVKGFNPHDYVGPKEAGRMDRFTQFAVAASLQAAEAAGLRLDNGDAEETGVIIGDSICGLLQICDQIKVLTEAGPEKVSPVLAPTMSGDAASIQVSLTLGTKGINYSPSSACSSSSDAIGQACDIIKSGQAKVVIAGGAEAPIIPIIQAAFNSCRALSTKNNGVDTACRPFDAERDGFVLGEGAAIMVLEDADYARERGAPILAEVIGYSATSDSFHLTQPSPDGEGAARSLRLALKRAGITPDDIDYVNAHGTATLLNDRAETRAMKSVLGERAYRVPVSGSKSQTGHLLGASGSLEAVICVLAMNHDVVPPTLNLTHRDPECDLDYVPNKARRAEIKTAVSNSFGFGGHNSTLVFRKYSE
ncbi:MAG: beta-ketoacyl-ACP synthase II [Dehalococcoidales bacterium]|nr:beta-ketoacyl-ACP synthase II [Dehalococcoidales bacterium]